MCRRSSVVGVVVAVVCLMGGTDAFAVEPLDGWVTGEQWEEAVEFAREEGRPLAVIQANAESTCPLHNGCADRFMRHRGLSDAVRVLVYTDDQPDGFREIPRQVEDPGRFVPRLFITDPDLRTVTMVQYEQRDELDERVDTAGQVLRWLKDSERRLGRVDAMAERGRFREAVERIERVGGEDQQVSVRIGRMEDPNDAGRESGESEAPPEGVFFPNLIVEGRERLERKAQAWVEEARELAEQKEYREARQKLVQLVRDRSDLPAVDEAQQLLEEVTAAMQQARAGR